MASDHLNRAAAERTKAASTRARRALKEMVTEDVPVTFASVARRAGVSTDFLYRQADFRRQIERLRAAPGGRQTQVAETTHDDGSTSSAVLALARQLREERSRRSSEIAELRNALAAAHGENLKLRRRLRTYE
ncbi:DUF6262 family protein [Nocardioides sp. Bht2]|uniref:DUF6262 family protein n=1 Tax=Nocardioides sp. Bht2 TaxID=3392297 RepID=UPI0039B5A939